MSQFKVGQRVRVVKHAEGRPNFGNWTKWEMGRFPIGSIATITEINKHGAICINNPKGKTAVNINPESFEPVEENMNQFKVGQRVRVVKYAEPFELDFANWHPFEKECFPIGSIATITAIGRNREINIADSEGNTAETLNPESFEPVEENMNFNAEEAIKQLQALGYTVTEPEFKLGQIWESQYGDYFLVCATMQEPSKYFLYHIKTGLLASVRPANKPSEYRNVFQNACGIKLYANDIKEAIEKGLKF